MKRILKKVTILREDLKVKKIITNTLNEMASSSLFSGFIIQNPSFVAKILVKNTKKSEPLLMPYDISSDYHRIVLATYALSKGYYSFHSKQDRNTITSALCMLFSSVAKHKENNFFCAKNERILLEALMIFEKEQKVFNRHWFFN